MAYLSFAPWPTETGVATARAATPADVDRFSGLELRVIGLAERGEPAGKERSRLARWMRWAFGLAHLSPLANARLESLRRFASLAAHQPEQVSDRDIEQLMAAGYSPGQAYGLLAYFSTRRPTGRAAA